MMTLRGLSFLFCLVAATAALAHQGVQNTAVKAWMDSMEVTADNTKVLGRMAKGVEPFDAEAARRAAAQIAREAERTPELFAARAEDPLSEASPDIWVNFDDFTAKSQALVVAAEGALTVSARDDLRPALAAIGAACKACHGEYRE